MGPAQIERNDDKKEYEAVHKQVYSGIEDELLTKREKTESNIDKKKLLEKLKGKSKKIKGNPNLTLDVNLNDEDLKKIKMDDNKQSFNIKKKQS